MSQAIANTKFLEIPQDSHIADPNKEDSDQTAQMRFLICVFVVRSTCVRNIYTRGMTHLNYLLRKQQLFTLSKLYHEPLCEVQNKHKLIFVKIQNCPFAVPM